MGMPSAIPSGDYINANGEIVDTSASAAINDFQNHEAMSQILQPIGPTAEQIAFQRAQEAARNNFNTGRDSVYNSAYSGADAKGTMLGRGIRDSLQALGDRQSGINMGGARNELAKMQGVSGIQGMVGRGIKSSGVMLGNRNAGDSSAAGALANAYGELGQREMAGVGNQYALANEDLNSQQTVLNRDRQDYESDYAGDKRMYVNDVVNQASQQFAQLNADAQNASLPDRIAIDQEKEVIRQNVLAKLQQYDAQLQQGMAGINANDQQARMTQANDLRQKGTDLGSGMFNFTQQAPMNFQGNAPSGGGLPIFTMPRRKR